MKRIAALASLLLLGACATAPPALDGPTALEGKDLNTAFNLYGQYDERVVLAGHENYIWRRAVILGGKSYYCELRAQPGYRDHIAGTVLRGYPAACALFSVQYQNVYARDPADTKKVKKLLANYRPVGAAADLDSPSGEGSMELSAR
ncbi:MAG: hypothetical protein ABW360_10705 [Phenylobacterium sp.]